jgi:hypothetical protein
MGFLEIFAKTVEMFTDYRLQFCSERNRRREIRRLKLEDSRMLTGDDFFAECKQQFEMAEFDAKVYRREFRTNTGL